MKLLLNILVGLIYLTGIAQTNPNLQPDYTLTKEEVNDLNSLFEKKRDNFDFQGKIIAYTIGTTGTLIEDKSIFFDKYLNAAINGEKKNVCTLIIFTKEEKTKSGGFDAVIMSPAKVFTKKHREILIDQLRKLSKSYKEKSKFEEPEDIDLNRVFLVNSVSLFKGYFYQGSDTEFHYFISKWDNKKDKYFKIKVNNLNVYNPFLFGVKEIRVSMMVSETEFGNNNSDKLYIQKE